MKKWMLRICGGFLALIVAAFLVLLMPFSSWMSEHRRDLESGSETSSTALGEIEFATVGVGTPLLRLHGSPGGYDGPIAGPRFRPEDYAGFRVISLSRPGYLRTPLSSGRTPAEQADLYAALLDKLGIERAIVYAVSGGGPSAVQFAIRHPHRTLGLVMVVPLLQAKPELAEEGRPSAIGQFASDFGWWLGGQLLAEKFGPKMMTGFDANDPFEMQQMSIAMKSFVPAALRLDGRENDKVQWVSLGIERWPLEKIKIPALIIHGNADENAPYEGSTNAVARIPNARLVTVEGGDHLIIVSRAREIHDHVRRFMADLGRG